MPASYYRLPVALAASLSLALAACASSPPPAKSAKAGGVQTAATDGSGDSVDTDATIWTMLGLAKEPSHQKGPHLGPRVNPTLWEATHQTLGFVHIAAQDPLTGTIITDWYTPPGKHDERLKVDVFINSSTLRLTALQVRVLRQVRSPDGNWVESTVDNNAHLQLEAAILNRARQIRHTQVVKAQES